MLERAQAGFYHYYGIDKKLLPRKLSGVYEHRVKNRKVPLVRGFDDIFLAPHSRHTETPTEAIRACRELTVLASSKEMSSTGAPVTIIPSYFLSRTSSRVV